MAKKTLNLDASEQAELLASFDPIFVLWIGLYGGYDSFAPQLLDDWDDDGHQTGKFVICRLMAKSAKEDKVSEKLAKKIKDELGEEEPTIVAKPREVRA